MKLKINNNFKPSIRSDTRLFALIIFTLGVANTGFSNTIPLHFEGEKSKDNNS